MTNLKEKLKILAEMAGEDLSEEDSDKPLSSFIGKDIPLSLEMAKSIITPLVPVKGKVPAGSKCTKCSSEDIERTIVPIGGPWSGIVTCKSCGYKESVSSHVAKSCISVEPLDINKSIE